MKYQIAIIGGGPAGYTAAEAAGRAGLSVVLFENKAWEASASTRVAFPRKPYYILPRCTTMPDRGRSMP